MLQRHGAVAAGWPLSAYHDCALLILFQEDWARWLNPEGDVASLLRPESPDPVQGRACHQPMWAMLWSAIGQRGTQPWLSRFSGGEGVRYAGPDCRRLKANIRNTPDVGRIGELLYCASRTTRGKLMSVEVELDAYVIPRTHKVFKFFPGKGYKFYDQILNSSVAFIDVRDLDKLDGTPREWEDDEVLVAISKDRVERSVAKGNPRPSRLVRSAGDKATHTFLNGLLFAARKGDLLVMPDKDYVSIVKIGRFLDDAGEAVSISSGDDGYFGKYFGRRVEWLGEIEKRFFDRKFIKLLHSQAAFFPLDPSYHETIYRLSFDNYVYDGQFVSTFRTTKNIFTSKDNLLTSLWFELIEVVEEARNEKTELTVDNIYELAVDSDIAEDERNDLSISVQSPGWFRLRSAVVSPFVAMALFTMAAANVSYDEAVAAKVTANVIQDADVACLGEVDDSVREYLELLGKDRWEQACKLANKAQAEATLKVDANLNRSRKAGKSPR